MAHIEISLATDKDRQAIYAIRHEVYASELGQYGENPQKGLTDSLDAFNEYIIAKREGTVLGFISITPPSSSHYSIDKYLSRNELPFPIDSSVCELRILTITRKHRQTDLALLLMFAALRWAESNSASRIVAIGRRDVISLYERIGFEMLGIPICSGAVEFETMTASTKRLRQQLALDRPLDSIVKRGLKNTIWHLPFPHEEDSRACVHGGDFFQAIGEDFQSLDNREHVIGADVLDAWFPPAPSVVEALKNELPWLLQTSPPVHAGGLTKAISQSRRIPERSIFLGAGSSDLIYRALRTWLTPTTRVLMLDPMYGEYAHICERVFPVHIDYFTLEKCNTFRFEEEAFERQLQLDYDLIILVNPNNPTGTYIPYDDIQRIVSLVPSSTTIWIDEAYIDFVPGARTVEALVAETKNVVVCKTLSKAYALSGVRAAYLVAHPERIESLRQWNPPWSVSLPAQLAAIEALKAERYYSACYAETELLRMELQGSLLKVPGLSVLSGLGNFLLCELTSLDLKTFLEQCALQGLYLRDISSMGKSVSSRMFRISVKDRETNRRMLQIIESVLYATPLS